MPPWSAGVADIQATLADLENADNYGTSVTDEMAETYWQYVTATSSDPTVTVLKPLAPGGKSVVVTLDLPDRTTESALSPGHRRPRQRTALTAPWRSSARAFQDLPPATATEGSWEAPHPGKGPSTQGVFNNAQNAYNDIRKVDKDLDNVKSASDPGLPSTA